MTIEQFERELRYRTVMAAIKTMLQRGLISHDEYDGFDRKMIEKYNPFYLCLGNQTSVDKVCKQR